MGGRALGVEITLAPPSQLTNGTRVSLWRVVRAKKIPKSQTDVLSIKPSDLGPRGPRRPAWRGGGGATDGTDTLHSSWPDCVDAAGLTLCESMRLLGQSIKPAVAAFHAQLAHQWRGGTMKAPPLAGSQVSIVVPPFLSPLAAK